MKPTTVLVNSLRFEEKRWSLWMTKSATNPNLPKIPVPNLKKTLTKYLEAVKAFTNKEELKMTRRYVEEFGSNDQIGPFLQNQLFHLAHKSKCWVNEFWYDEMYLCNRLPLPVYSNPCEFMPLKTSLQNDNIALATHIIDAMVDLNKNLKGSLNRILKQEDLDLCTFQFNAVFGQTRIPGKLKDHLFKNDESNHIIVACKNDFFVVNLRHDGRFLSKQEIYFQLKSINETAKEDEASKIGVLTSAMRDQWFLNREELMKDPLNCDSLKQIESSLFVISLDENDKRDSNITVNDSLIKTNGTNTSQNSCNRWFDKSLQFFVFDGMTFSFSFEHTACDGGPIFYVAKYLKEKIVDQNKVDIGKRHSSSLTEPKKLKWNVSEYIQREINSACSYFDSLVSSVDIAIFDFDGLNKDQIKDFDLSPDAFIQLALQLTYYKIHGCLTSTYASSSLRKFQYGRVENNRSSTNEALQFCRAIVQNKSGSLQYLLLREAILKQKKLQKEVSQGFGIDNHLTALKRLSDWNGMSEQSIFSDKTYQKFSQFELSTSQVTLVEGFYISYGPVVDDGYGVNYSFTDEGIRFGISSLTKSSATESSLQFANVLKESLCNMRELCCKPW